MPKIVSSGILGGYDWDEAEDGSCVVMKDGKVICVQPSPEAMRQWVMEQRHKRIAAEQDQHHDAPIRPAK
jgi:hypothetical protein